MARQWPPITPEKVLELFREAWPNGKWYPNSSACYSVAVKINVVRVKGVKPPKRQLFLGVEAAKYARLFLRRLTAGREQLQNFDIRRYDGTFPSYPKELVTELFGARQIVELIEKMQAVERDVCTLLDAPSPFPDHRNAAGGRKGIAFTNRPAVRVRETSPRGHRAQLRRKPRQRHASSTIGPEAEKSDPETRAKAGANRSEFSPLDERLRPGRVALAMFFDDLRGVP
jgi:hypothetical protein